jgi:hypothetical protein
VFIKVLSLTVLNTINAEFRNLSQLNPFYSIIEKQFYKTNFTDQVEVDVTLPRLYLVGSQFTSEAGSRQSYIRFLMS